MQHDFAMLQSRQYKQRNAPILTISRVLQDFGFSLTDGGTMTATA